MILELVPAYCWVELGSGVSGYRALGIVDLVPVHGVWGLVLAPLVAGAMFSGSFGLRVS